MFGGGSLFSLFSLFFFRFSLLCFLGSRSSRSSCRLIALCWLCRCVQPQQQQQLEQCSLQQCFCCWAPPPAPKKVVYSRREDGVVLLLWWGLSVTPILWCFSASFCCDSDSGYDHRKRPLKQHHQHHHQNYRRYYYHLYQCFTLPRKTTLTTPITTTERPTSHHSFFLGFLKQANKQAHPLAPLWNLSITTRNIQTNTSPQP